MDSPQIKQNAIMAKQVDMGTIYSFHFSSTCSVIVVKLRTSCIQNSTIIPYKVDTVSNGNIMP